MTLVYGWLKRTPQRPIYNLAARLPARIGSRLLRLILPQHCVHCGSDLLARGNPLFLCPSCQRALPVFEGPACRRCASPLPESLGSSARCARCAKVPMRFDEVVALGPYCDSLRELVLRTKRATGNAVCALLAEMLWQRRRDRLTAALPDVVVAVPMHWSRRVVRGTSGPAELAESLARRLKVPAAVGLLKRRRNTLPQFSLPPTRRFQNVHGAFAVRGGYHLTGAHVLLVDDILTTGATSSEAARTLKRAGAQRVTVAVDARSVPPGYVPPTKIRN